MKKTQIFVLLLLVVLGVAIAGCLGKSSPAEQITEQANKPITEVTLMERESFNFSELNLTLSFKGTEYYGNGGPTGIVLYIEKAGQRTQVFLEPGQSTTFQNTSFLLRKVSEVKRYDEADVFDNNYLRLPIAKIEVS